MCPSNRILPRRPRLWLLLSHQRLGRLLPFARSPYFPHRRQDTVRRTRTKSHRPRSLPLRLRLERPFSVRTSKARAIVKTYVRTLAHTRGYKAKDCVVSPEIQSGLPSDASKFVSRTWTFSSFLSSRSCQGSSLTPRSQYETRRFACVGAP